MDVKGKNIMIFVKTDDKGKTHYKAGMSSKKQDGSYDNAYIDVRLPKDTKVENKEKINITKGFLTFYNYKGKDNKNHTIWYIVVQEFLRDEEITKVESYTTQDLDEGMELPF